MKDDFSTFIVHALDLTAFPLGRLYTDVILFKKPLIFGPLLLNYPVSDLTLDEARMKRAMTRPTILQCPSQLHPEPQNHLTTNESMLVYR